MVILGGGAVSYERGAPVIQRGPSSHTHRAPSQPLQGPKWYPIVGLRKARTMIIPDCISSKTSIYNLLYATYVRPYGGSSGPSLISMISIYKTGLSVSAHTVPKQGPGSPYSSELMSAGHGPLWSRGPLPIPNGEAEADHPEC
jgi:hypothetical protein